VSVVRFVGRLAFGVLWLSLSLLVVFIDVGQGGVKGARENLGWNFAEYVQWLKTGRWPDEGFDTEPHRGDS
jgi:hypothetical protein